MPTSIKKFFKPVKKVDGTERIEAFSDGIFAFSITLLVMDIKIPPLNDLSNQAALTALFHQFPKFIIFLFSFLVIAILWVNHHHFFHNFKHSDWKFLWHNNLLMLWVILIPFATAFLGDQPFQPIVVMLYSFIMFLAVFSFMLMVRYVFFKSTLLDLNIPLMTRKKEYRRVFPAVFMYAFATIVAPWFVYFSLAILVLVPLIYFVPSFIEERK